jgi:hypothetical protein
MTDTKMPDCPAEADPTMWRLWTLLALPPAVRGPLARRVLDGATPPDAWRQESQQ